MKITNKIIYIKSKDINVKGEIVFNSVIGD